MSIAKYKVSSILKVTLDLQNEITVHNNISIGHVN